MNKKYFHLTLGPVQGFVAQARRSRDYWAGSFLLSWLSGVAILSVKAQNGDIKFPIPDDNFLNAIKEGNLAGSNPKQGGIPNRFTTEGISVEVDDDFNPSKVVADIKAAWIAIADVVWQEDIHGFCEKSSFHASDIADIWNRQINDFWDISWVITEDKQATNLLDRRKNWRSHYPYEEFGSKCMMMEGWQEFSGTVKSNIAKSDSFWRLLRKTVANGGTDFNQGEQLCALAYVKRRFARYFEQVNKVLPSGLVVNGWSFVNLADKNIDKNSPIHVPSLPFLAAVPWLASVLEQAHNNQDINQALTNFAEQGKAGFGLPSSNVHFNVFKSLQGSNSYGLDGMCFFPNMLLAQQSDTQNSDKNTEIKEDAVKKKIEKSFKALQATLKETKLTTPSPFYALLIMDGDSLGKQMSDPEKQLDISNALNEFTQKVQTVVSDNNGFLIYAGGDDVLALLPLEYAIPCATAVKHCYDQCFEGKKAVSTISAGIQFAHIKTPLMKIIKNAHSLLDDVAKNETGRDSLAIRIHKPGGLHAQWSMPWQALLEKNELQTLITQLSQTDNPSLTNGWLMRAFDLFSVLTNKGELSEGITEQSLNALISQEYLHSGIVFSEQDKSKNKQLADGTIKDLLSICKKIKRISDAGENYQQQQVGYQADAIKVVRFLATKGVQD